MKNNTRLASKNFIILFLTLNFFIPIIKGAARQEPASITFGIIDLKFDGKNIKICEFGDGLTSSFEGSNVLYGKGKVWKKFWQYLGSFNVPIWHGNDINIPNPEKNNDSKKFERLMAFDELVRQKGNIFQAMAELIMKPSFLRSTAGKKNNDPTKISNFNAIVTRSSSCHSIFIKQKLDPLIQTFKSLFPTVLIVNDGISEQLNNKLLSSIPFLSKNLKKYRPNFVIVDRLNGETINKSQIQKLTMDLIGKLNCKMYIIKPIDSTKGQGILVSSKNNLPKVLQAIFEQKNIDGILEDTLDFWSCKTNSPFFLVEKYEHSKKVVLEDGKKYDPAMRMVFTLDYNNNKENLNFLRCFWKTPTHSVNDQGTLTQRYRSRTSGRRINPYVRANKRDSGKVKEILRRVIPQFYSQIKSKTVEKRIFKRLISINHKKSCENLRRYLELLSIKIC